LLVDRTGGVIGVGLAGRRLVSLLTLHGPTSRAFVCEQLWPELPAHRAAHRLRNTLWRLDLERSVLGPRAIVDVAGEGLGLAPLVAVDLYELKAAAAAVRAGQVSGVDARIFAADLLPGWDDDWLLFDRERIRQLRLHALEQLSHLLLERGECALALDAALTALHADPLRESAHRAVIRVHLAEGNHAAALRTFEQCRETLDTELGVRPTRALLALMAALDRSTPSVG
jgi:DNA-binding SARP family transcriptional activator